MTADTATSPPADLDALRELIARESERLTPRMRDAARYTIEHPNDIALNPVATVAEMSRIAPAAFVRMAKALGFAGYSELQRLLREPLQHAGKPTFKERIRHYGGEETLDHPEDPAEVLRAFSRANIVSLEHLQENAASLPLAEAIAMVQKARLVHVLGLRRSYAVAAYLAYALNRVGRPAVQITGIGGAIAEQASIIRADDLLIAISFPPYAADTLQVCEQVRKKRRQAAGHHRCVSEPCGQRGRPGAGGERRKAAWFSVVDLRHVAGTDPGRGPGVQQAAAAPETGAARRGDAAASHITDLLEVDC